MDVKTMVARGYFPIELPPPFTSQEFAEASTDLTPRRRRTEAARFNLARVGGLRRGLSIPNPESQLATARELVQCWKDLVPHFERSKLSVSRPVEDAVGVRALRTAARFHEQPRIRSRRMHRARFTLQSDISQCYSSIYTHSITWALHGKSKAKAALGNAKLSGDDLDRAVRDGQSGQTKGIPIGPDTSLAIAETLLCAIDSELQDRHSRIGSSGLRFMDDIEVFTRTRSEAEDILLAWESALGRYELLINPEKTRIVDGPVGLDASWRTRLSQFSIRTESDGKTANDIIAFFNLAFELARETPREAIVSWAVQRFREFDFGPQSWSVFGDLLLPSAIAEPSCLRYVSEALRRGRTVGRVPNRSRVAETLNALVAHHAPLEHGAEVTWALWILAENAAPLDSGPAGSVAAMSDNAALIVLQYLSEVGLAKTNDFDLSDLEATALAPDVLRSPDWLLAYESARHGWLSDHIVKSDPFFTTLLERGVRFFQPDRLASPAAALPSTGPAVVIRDVTAPGEDLLATEDSGEVPVPDLSTDY